MVVYFVVYMRYLRKRRDSVFDSLGAVGAVLLSDDIV